MRRKNIPGRENSLCKGSAVPSWAPSPEEETTQGVGSLGKTSDLAWAIAETRGMCGRERKCISGKENSLCKGLEAGGYDAFEELET